MYGLSKNRIEKIIWAKLNKNPDLKYYIDNDYIDELVSLLIDGISEAIEENTKKAIDDVTKELTRKL